MSGGGGEVAGVRVIHIHAAQRAARPLHVRRWMARARLVETASCRTPRARPSPPPTADIFSCAFYIAARGFTSEAARLLPTCRELGEDEGEESLLRGLIAGEMKVERGGGVVGRPRLHAAARVGSAGRVAALVRVGARVGAVNEGGADGADGGGGARSGGGGARAAGYGGCGCSVCGCTDRIGQGGRRPQRLLARVQKRL